MKLSINLEQVLKCTYMQYTITVLQRKQYYFSIGKSIKKMDFYKCSNSKLPL